MKQPKFKIGDTIVLERRWFLFFEDYIYVKQFLEDLIKKIMNGDIH